MLEDWQDEDIWQEEDGMLEGWRDEDISQEEDGIPRLTLPLEQMSILLPSSLRPADIQRLGLESMARHELELRQGQANDSLEGLRVAIAHKSLLYRTHVSVHFYQFLILRA
jgi:hypothetical protein